MSDLLDAFLPAVGGWFSETFGEPTPPQAEGWPAIQRGEHTLILSPTGSGKTLAAFLWGIDELYREVAQAGDDYEEGVRLLYVSPLKALNNDVERNLRAPLRASDDPAVLSAAIDEAISRKPKGHDFDYSRQRVDGQVARHMSVTGG